MKKISLNLPEHLVEFTGQHGNRSAFIISILEYAKSVYELANNSSKETK